MTTLFGLTSFLAAFLLFLIEPMIGKNVLPLLGGAPSVWNTCLFYFQGVLLLGYILAHAAAPGRARAIRYPTLALLATLLTIGFALPGPLNHNRALALETAASTQPVLALLTLLARSSLAPLIAIAAISPLVQAWLAASQHTRAHDPYFLYASSNAGSLLALELYPLAIEPAWPLLTQEHLWRFGFAALTLLVLASGLITLLTRDSTAPQPNVSDLSRQTPNGPLTWMERFALVAIPSLWLPAVTTYLTTDLASIPLLWTIPLALYLLSFIIAFAHPSGFLIRASAQIFPGLAAAWALVMAAGFTHLVWIPLHLALFAAGSCVCLGRLVLNRPPATQATLLYLVIALGGLCGSLFAAVLAPMLLNRLVEYPAAVILACSFLPSSSNLSLRTPRTILRTIGPGALVSTITALLVTNQRGLGQSTLGALLIVLAAGAGVHCVWYAQRNPARLAFVLTGLLSASGLTQGPGGQLIHIERGFFGVVRVTELKAGALHRLFLGSTLHGEQHFNARARSRPTTYFTTNGPIGDVIRALEADRHSGNPRIAIVGLGAGTMAAYAQAQEFWDFYEIDPLVIKIASNPRYFTYLADCPANLTVIPGDARLRIQNAPAQAYRLIVLDAFSSDATPVHLITREAIALYLSKLEPAGLLVFNLTNRYLNLDHVMARQANDAGLVYRVRYDLDVSAAERAQGKQPSIWCVLARRETDLGPIAADPRWNKRTPNPSTPAWTDEFSDLAAALILTPWRHTTARP